MANLQLSLKKQWFDLTKSGEKTEDYREINGYWVARLFKIKGDKESNIELALTIKNSIDIDWLNIYLKNEFKKFKTNTMTLGYPKSTDTDRILKLEHKGIEIGYGKPEWGAEPNKLYFIIKHGAIL